MSEFITLQPKTYTMKKRLNRIKENELVFRHGHIAITNYKMGDNREFEKTISVFNEITHKYELKGGYYVKDLREFRINRGFDLGLLSKFFTGYTARVDNDAYPCDKVKIELFAAPRDDFQRVALTFMACKGEYQSNAKYTQQVIDADTGDGKTYCGVSSACFLSARTVIFVPFSKLLKQWTDAFEGFTSLKPDEIMIVQGAKACRKILDGKCKHVKIFLFMTDTLDSFCDRYGDLEAIELLRATNAYTKIVDEIHRDMKTVSMIEALSNFKMNFYMSASPGRADKKENWIFKSSFKNIPRFGASFKMQSEKHINVVIKKYDFIPNTKQINAMVNRRKQWLNSKSYERELINASSQQRESFENALNMMLKWSKGLLKDDNKILILMNTIDGTEYMKNIAEKFFPGEVSRYYGTMASETDKAEALTKRVICATASSLGTGADIKGIQHVYNCTTYSNWIDATQLPGRARRLKDPTVQVMYIEFVNFAYQKTFKQYMTRKPYLQEKAKTGKLMLVD